MQSGTFDADGLRPFVRGCDLVVSCYSADDDVMVRGQKLLVDLCAAEGVPRFMPSDFSYDYTKLADGELLVKESSKRVKEYLDGKTGIRGVHVMLGCFMELVIYGIGIWRPAEKKLLYWGTDREYWELITYRNAAEYIAAMALDAEATGIFRGTRKNTFEIAEAFERAYGFKPGMEPLCSLEDLRQNMTKDGKQDPFQTTIYYIMTGQITFGDNFDNSRYPDVKPESLTQFLETHSLLN